MKSGAQGLAYLSQKQIKKDCFWVGNIFSRSQSKEMCLSLASCLSVWLWSGHQRVCRDRASPTAKPQEREERLLSAALSSAEELPARDCGCGGIKRGVGGKTCHGVKGGRQRSLELSHAPACQSFAREILNILETYWERSAELDGAEKEIFCDTSW